LDGRHDDAGIRFGTVRLGEEGCGPYIRVPPNIYTLGTLVLSSIFHQP
jgi:hypothetical protein